MQQDVDLVKLSGRSSKMMSLTISVSLAASNDLTRGSEQGKGRHDMHEH